VLAGLVGVNFGADGVGRIGAGGAACECPVPVYVVPAAKRELGGRNVGVVLVGGRTGSMFDADAGVALPLEPSAVAVSAGVAGA
jgi:hypothetical protein